MVVKSLNQPCRNSKELAEHVKYVNPWGLGRRYSIYRLIVLFRIRPGMPRRITEVMRLELSEVLDALGIGYDGLLDKHKKSTRLFAVLFN